MPVHAVEGGFRWGTRGKVYRTRGEAEAQAAAIYASGWREDSPRGRQAKRELHKSLSPSKRAEDGYTRALVTLMRGVHRGVLRAIEEHLVPEEHVRHDADPIGPGKGAEAWAKIGGRDLGARIAKHLAPKVSVAFSKMAKKVDDKNARSHMLIGIAPQAPGVQAAIVIARSNSIRLIEDAGRDYADDVREVLTDPASEGLRVEEIRDKLRERGNVSLSRATLIAVDQTLKLSAGLNQFRQRAAGVAHYVWSTSKDERVRPTHADLEGQTFSWDEPPETNDDGDTNAPGEDYRCFPGDSKLQLAHGATKAFRRWYDGELASVVTDSGKTIRGTPNHPVLTRRGWVALGSLQLSDHLLEVSEKALRSTEEDDHDRVASIGDAFAAMQILGTSQAVRGEATDFHGDGRKGDVDVVLAARPLALGLLARRYQSRQELPLADPDPARLGLRLGDQLLDGAVTSTEGGLRWRDELSSRLSGHASHPELVCLTSSSDPNAGASQARRQHDTFNAGSLRDREQALASLVRGDNGTHVDVEHRPGCASTTIGPHADSAEFLAQVVGVDPERTGGLVQGLSCVQKFARVCHVDRLPFHGWVFNLETATGWYAIEGILAHNCRCVALPITSDEEPEGEGGEEESEPGDEDVEEGD